MSAGDPASTVPSSTDARMLIHDLENDLAAIRIRLDLMLKELSAPELDFPASVRDDVSRLQEVVDHATGTLRVLSSSPELAGVEHGTVR